MKSFNKTLAKHAEKVRLLASERHELRERVLMYMEYHPLPKDARRGAFGSVSESPLTYVRAYIRTTYARVGTAVLALFLVLVSIPFVAEQAVPGDVLYPVKTRLNESVLAQFADSPYEKIAFETELMERRIAEARLLAKEGKLDEEAEAQIAESVRHQADVVQKSIADLRVSDADEAAIASITFGSALDVQSALFASSTDTTVDRIADVVRQAKVNADAEKGTTTPSYERLLATVEQATTRAHEYFTTVQNSATDGEEEKIERRLADIERKVAAAREVYAEGKSDGAVGLLSVALTDIQKLISFMTDLDVRESVTLDTLVPVVLTPEERLTVIEGELMRIQTTWDIGTTTATTTYETATTTPSELTVPDVVQTALDDVPTLVETVSLALDAGNIAAAEDAVKSAEALVAAVKQFEAEEAKAVELNTESAAQEDSSPSGDGVPGEPDTSSEMSEDAETGTSTDSV